MASRELDSEKGKVTWTALITVDKPLLSLPARSGIDRQLSRQAVACAIGVGLGLVRQPAERRGARPDRKRKAGSPQSIAACSLARRRPHAVAEFAAPSARCAASVQRGSSSRS